MRLDQVNRQTYVHACALQCMVRHNDSTQTGPNLDSHGCKGRT